MLKGARQRAERHGLRFNLTEADIRIPKKCPVLGIVLSRNHGKGQTDRSPSLDRIVPRKGYTRGNVVVVSMRANRIKSDATLAELRKIVRFYQEIK